MTDADTHELLSALLDREPVDPDQLAVLLERPDARAVLVDFVRLRAVLAGDGAAAVVAAHAGVPRRRSIARPLLGLAAAALLMLTGALVGSRFGTADGQRPPEPTRVVKLVPAGAAAGGVR